VLGGLLDRTLTTGTPAAPVICDRLAGWWPRARDPLLAAIDRRTDDRLTSLRAKLAARQDDERRRIVTGARAVRRVPAQGAGRRRGAGGDPVQRDRGQGR